MTDVMCPVYRLITVFDLQTDTELVNVETQLYQQFMNKTKAERLTFRSFLSQFSLFV